jgi:hypothetical protein
MPVFLKVQVGTTGKAQTKLSQHTFFATPVITNTIAVFSIPLGPTRWELPYLVAALANIPRFSN